MGKARHNRVTPTKHTLSPRPSRSDEEGRKSKEGLTNNREIDIAWAAGFTDGEGCIYINRYRKRKAPQLQLIWVQKVLTPVEKLLNIFPKGRVRIAHRSNKRQFYEMKLHGDSAMNALIEMLPYLTEKRPQAEVAIEFQKNVARYRGTWTSQGIPDEVKEWRNKMATKISELKRSAGATTESLDALTSDATV